VKKYLPLFVLAAAVCASPAVAQNRIELHPDINMGACAISEPLMPPIVQVYVFITGPATATGARFSVPKPGCWVGSTWLGDALPPGTAVIGTSQSDWSLAFYHGGWPCSGSQTPPIYIGAISFLISNQSQPCCHVEAVPGLAYSFTDCNFAEHPLEPGVPMVVNPDASCGCQGGILTATESVTWGRVKAMYR
jgi:hypothetical protein